MSENYPNKTDRAKEDYMDFNRATLDSIVELASKDSLATSPTYVAKVLNGDTTLSSEVLKEIQEFGGADLASKVREEMSAKVRLALSDLFAQAKSFAFSDQENPASEKYDQTPLYEPEGIVMAALSEHNYKTDVTNDIVRIHVASALFVDSEEKLLKIKNTTIFRDEQDGTLVITMISNKNDQLSAYRYIVPNDVMVDSIEDIEQLKEAAIAGTKARHDMGLDLRPSYDQLLELENDLRLLSV